MKRSDAYLVLGLIIFCSPFLLSDQVFSAYVQLNREHGFVMSFVKFAILATLGEAIGLRIVAGVYNQPGFGLLPRAIVWGFLGVIIKFAFVIFATGVPNLLEYAGMENVRATMAAGLSLEAIFIAFTISVLANVFFGPIMMTFHKVTDIHIVNNGGTVSGLLKPIKVGEILTGINWYVQWDLVFKKMIPLFWFPAHTITFLLPSDMRILFAAFLGICLGVMMALASLKGREVPVAA